MNDNSRMAEFIGTAARQDIQDYNDLAPYWNMITTLGIATHDELEIACNQKTWNIETVNEVIKDKTGYNDLQHMWNDYRNR